ncbi:hypothetical protein JOC77_001194 [Peribacillus deserti]|uniref:YqfQ-like protein n=1 Tax=Peribacillus deserti TaxID=673318 RepID=A0ABS2QG38_9BACI|nr:YqfQ family protein [Peribacillus deserti]MBM7691784.1 hypothetical protein [Peribacillus deserti]
MPPRQPQIPFGPGPYGPHHYGMGAPRTRYHHPHMPFNPYQGGTSPARQAPIHNVRKPKRGGGGLISKLLGKKSRGPAPQAASPFTLPARAASNSAAPGSGGIIQSLTQGGGLTGILNNTQKVLQTVQQVGPIVEQYGPLVKNLPAMWKLYRGLKSADTPPDSDSEAAKTEPETEKEFSRNDRDELQKEHDEDVNHEESGISRPKIFF